MMTFVSFDEWLKTHPAPMAAPCPTCDGTGEHKCDCGAAHDCGRCGGTGATNSLSARLDIARREYDKEIAAIVDRLRVWGATV